MKVIFVHDVICSFCYPMSRRMHQLQSLFPELEIEHRSFALGWEVSDFERMFGSHQRVKDEVLTHWQVANANDGADRFNIEGMKQVDFHFPTSKNALLAAKAAGIVGGEEMYWEVFDALQAGLFQHNQDISNPKVIHSIIQTTSIKEQAWKEAYASPTTKQAVLNDLALNIEQGIDAVPALIVEDQYIIHGALPLQKLTKIMKELISEQTESVCDGEVIEGEVCHYENGTWYCE